MKLIILGLLLLFFIILISYEIYEGFSNQPLPSPTSVRANNTCSDPEMTYMYDNYDYATPWSSNGCPSNTFSNNYFGTPYCLPQCVSGYTPYANDNTYCVNTSNVCILSSDLNSTIQTSWTQVCGPLYRTNVNIMSTLGSISTVVNTIDSQFIMAQSNYLTLSNYVDNYTGGLPIQTSLRSQIFDTIIKSNYSDLINLKSNVDSNFIAMSNKKDRFNYIFNAFDCGNYM